MKRSLNLIKKAAVAAEKARLRWEDEHEIIRKELSKIANSDKISVGYMYGDGIGVCVEKCSNCDSAHLKDVIAFIERNGSITEDDILDMTCL